MEIETITATLQDYYKTKNVYKHSLKMKHIFVEGGKEIGV
jgi:hypothetical protein